MTSPAHIENPSEARSAGGTVTGPGTLTGPIDLDATAPPAEPHVQTSSEDWGPLGPGPGDLIAADAPTTEHATPPSNAMFDQILATQPTQEAGGPASEDMATAAQSSDLAAPATPHLQTPSDDARGITITTSEAEPTPTENPHQITPPSEAPYSPLLVKPYRD